MNNRKKQDQTSYYKADQLAPYLGNQSATSLPSQSVPNHECLAYLKLERFL